jgi:hypothetical protein
MAEQLDLEDYINQLEEVEEAVDKVLEHWNRQGFAAHMDREEFFEGIGKAGIKITLDKP